METLIIRNETPADYQAVEHLTREAFWNQYVPGCSEHYLVHVMRQHPDYIPQLAFVLELDGRIIGSIHYTRAALADQTGAETPILTFGPVSILPQFQRKGYGKRLMEHSFQRAAATGYDVIVIFGNPDNYVARGFKGCKKYNVCLAPEVFPSSLLVKELTPGALDGRPLFYRESPVGALCEDTRTVDAFDAAFPPKEKGWQPSQEAFYIHSHSLIVR